MVLTWNQREVIQSSFRDVYTACSSTWKSGCVVITEYNQKWQTASHDSTYLGILYKNFEVLLLCNNCFALWFLTHPLDMWINPFEGLIFSWICCLLPFLPLKMSVSKHCCTWWANYSTVSLKEPAIIVHPEHSIPVFSSWDQNDGREFWKI